MIDWIDQLAQTWRYRRMPRTPNLIDVAHQLSAESSAEYQTQHMRKTPDYPYDLALHRDMIQQMLPQGHILEFGVATGRTIRNFARYTPRQIWGFDSFEGLPETWTWLFPQGSFAQRQPVVPKTVGIVEGWFSDTLPAWTRNVPGACALIHIDVDLYSSARTILTELESRIVPGTIVIFDEYMNYPGWQQDEFRAWQEHCVKYSVKYEYIGRVSSHQQVAVRVLSKAQV
jgi:predicted O-methyltransferase YrrM